MTQMLDVLALDLATTTGFARGLVGCEPIAGTIKFAAHAGMSNDMVFARALAWFEGYLTETGRPNLIYVEKMLPPEAMKNQTSRAVRDRLAGLHGIIRATAFRAGLLEIQAVEVGSIRGHFLGARGLRRDAAKAAVVERCRALGWKCANDNEGDALALWSYGCSQIDPVQALRVSPLFNRSLRVR